MEQQEYRMPAGTLLYAVYRLHRRGIYGLPNQMPSLSDKSFPLFAQELEQNTGTMSQALQQLEDEDRALGYSFWDVLQRLW